MHLHYEFRTFLQIRPLIKRLILEYNHRYAYSLFQWVSWFTHPDHKTFLNLNFMNFSWGPLLGLFFAMAYQYCVIKLSKASKCPLPFKMCPLGRNTFLSLIPHLHNQVTSTRNELWFHCQIQSSTTISVLWWTSGSDFFRIEGAHQMGFQEP